MNPSLRIAFWLPLLWWLACMAAEAAMPVLRVLAWPGYADDDVVRAFEQQSGARVDVTQVSSDAEMWQRLNAHDGGDFDVFAVNTAELQRYIDGGLVQPIPDNAIPNRQHQSARFRDVAAIPGLLRDGRLYAVPYTYSEMGLIYDRRKFPQPPTSISVLWDERYRGRILAYDGGSHDFALAAQSLGLANPFHIDEGEWPVLVDSLIALRRNVLAFYTQPDEAVQLFRSNRVVLLFANYGTQQVTLLKQAGLDVGYSLPREGALAWLDCWAITRKTADPALAQAWINYTLTDAVSGLLVSRQGLNNTLTEMPAAGGATAPLAWLQPVEDAGRRNALWQRIISGDSAARVLAP